MQYGELNNQAIKNFTWAIMSMWKSLTVIKTYTQERYNTILLTKPDSFTKGAIYIA